VTELHHPAAHEESRGPAARSGLADLLGGLSIAAVSLGFAAASLRIPFSSPLWRWYTSPGVYPAAIAAATMAMALVVAVRGWKRWQAGRQAMAWAGFSGETARWGLHRLAWFLVIVAGFLLMLGRVPFWVSTSTFIIATILTTSGNAVGSLRPALVGVAVVYVIFVLIFQRLFGIGLP
jgi:hypothetical protein